MNRRVAFLACALIAGSMSAQGTSRTVVRVVGVDGRPVAYALVRVGGGADAIASDEGQVAVAVTAGDSVRVSVRRMGYRPHDSLVARDGTTGDFVVTLVSLAGVLDTVRVVARQSTPLARTGFYERAQRVRRGAMTGEFITPEELEARNAGKLSQIFEGRISTRIAMTNLGGRQQAVLLGRGRCSMSIVLDGIPVTNTLQEVVPGQVLQSIMPNASVATGTRPGERTGLGTRIGLDDVADARSVMAIEIYPSTANGPAELIPISGRGSCGFVAIWTGARR